MVWDPRNTGGVGGHDYGSRPFAGAAEAAPTYNTGAASGGAAAGGAAYGSAFAAQPQAPDLSGQNARYDASQRSFGEQPTYGQGMSQPATSAMGSGGLTGGSGYQRNADGSVTPSSYGPGGTSTPTGPSEPAPWSRTGATFVSDTGARSTTQGGSPWAWAIDPTAGFLSGLGLFGSGQTNPQSFAPSVNAGRSPSQVPSFTQPVQQRAPAAASYADPHIGFSAPTAQPQQAAPAQRYADPRIGFNAPPVAPALSAHTPGAFYSARGQN